MNDNPCRIVLAAEITVRTSHDSSFPTVRLLMASAEIASCTRSRFRCAQVALLHSVRLSTNIKTSSTVSASDSTHRSRVAPQILVLDHLDELVFHVVNSPNTLVKMKLNRHKSDWI